MDIKIGIYKITSPSGKIYVGQSINIEHRLYYYKAINGCVKEQTKIYNSLKKYGPENHKFEIIEECSEELLSEREIYWIEFYDCVKSGLNLRHGGEGGGKASEETKQKMIKFRTGRKQSKETIEKRRKKITGLKRSDESRKNISVGKTGVPITWGDEIKKAKALNPYIPGEKHKEVLRHNNAVPVEQYNLNGEFIKEFFSYKEAERQTGISAGCILHNLKGNTKTAGGYTWKRKTL